MTQYFRATVTWRKPDLTTWESTRYCRGLSQVGEHIKWAVEHESIDAQQITVSPVERAEALEHNPDIDRHREETA